MKIDCVRLALWELLESRGGKVGGRVKATAVVEVVKGKFIFSDEKLQTSASDVIHQRPATASTYTSATSNRLHHTPNMQLYQSQMWYIKFLPIYPFKKTYENISADPIRFHPRPLTIKLSQGYLTEYPPRNPWSL